MALTKRYPTVLARYRSALQWLDILHNLGRALATLDAYARGLARLMLALAYYGALRRAELVALRIEDLDVDQRLILPSPWTTQAPDPRRLCDWPPARA